jgi:hypothetical protein
MLAEDSADEKYIFLTSLLRAINIHFNGQNDTQAESVKIKVSLDNH